jgi:hypothetical protein
VLTFLSEAGSCLLDRTIWLGKIFELPTDSYGRGREYLWGSSHREHDWSCIESEKLSLIAAATHLALPNRFSLRSDKHHSDQQTSTHYYSSYDSFSEGTKLSGEAPKERRSIGKRNDPTRQRMPAAGERPATRGLEEKKSPAVRRPRLPRVRPKHAFGVESWVLFISAPLWIAALHHRVVSKEYRRLLTRLIS